ncbi:GNAT family N-acetyltransferase [Patescibacteria group bacterium]|nr:GNAT family N-acetyltransferase [Patescibacteria group bacterium]
MGIQIILAETNSKEINAFEKREWQIADLEHYGKQNVDFAKKIYKLVAKNSDDKIVGILKLVIEVNLALIETLIVSSAHRKMGIGKKLLTQAENLAKKSKCTKVYLETNEEWDAVNFYKKNGYKITGIHEKHILNQNTLILTKFLYGIDSV